MEGVLGVGMFAEGCKMKQSELLVFVASQERYGVG